MAEEEKNNEKDVAAKESPKKSIARWVILGCAVGVVVAGGYFGWTLYRASGEKNNNQKVQQTETAGNTPAQSVRVICPLESFIVNLSDKSGFGKRYLKATIEIEVSGETEKKRVESHKTQLRDAILMLLTSRTMEEINTVEGKLDLKQALLVRINQTLSDNIVHRLYFTEFVIQ